MEFESWNVDEHDPLAVQLKLFGLFDCVVHIFYLKRPPRTFGELQLQLLESENRSDRLPSLPWFLTHINVLSH